MLKDLVLPKAVGLPAVPVRLIVVKTAFADETHDKIAIREPKRGDLIRKKRDILCRKIVRFGEDKAVFLGE